MVNSQLYMHWYELNPSRLEMEKMAMSALFPEFEMTINDCGILKYKGTLKDDRFNRKEGYIVEVEYTNGGTENFGNPGIVVTAISPTFEDLFSDRHPYSSELMQKLLSQIAIENTFIEYEDPIVESTATIITCAALLRRTIGWFALYETEKARMELEADKKKDEAAAHRRELRERLMCGCRVKITNGNHNGDDVNSEPGTTESALSAGEIEHIEYLLKHFRVKCSAYFDLLPEDEQVLSKKDKEIVQQLVESYGFEWEKSDVKFALNPSIAPMLILRGLDHRIVVKKDEELKLYHFPLPGGGYYAFNTDCLQFPFEANSLILFYFIKNATSFTLPLIWHSLYGKRELIIQPDDKPQSSFFHKDLDIEWLKSLPFGFEIPKVEDRKIFRFNYYFWHSWTGYVKCKVRIEVLKESDLLCESDIKIEESTEILYHYNCRVRY